MAGKRGLGAAAGAGVTLWLADACTSSTTDIYLLLRHCMQLLIVIELIEQALSISILSTILREIEYPQKVGKLALACADACGGVHLRLGSSCIAILQGCRGGGNARALARRGQVAEYVVQHKVALLLHRQEKGLHKLATCFALHQHATPPVNALQCLAEQHRSEVFNATSRVCISKSVRDVLTLHCSAPVTWTITPSLEEYWLSTLQISVTASSKSSSVTLSWMFCNRMNKRHQKGYGLITEPAQAVSLIGVPSWKHIIIELL